MLAHRAPAVRPVLAFILALVLVTPPALVRGNNLLVMLMVLVAAAAIIGLVMPRLALRGVSVRRLLPRHGRVGESMRIRYSIGRTARHWIPAFSVGIDERLEGPRVDVEHKAWVLHVAPGDTVHGDMRLRPLERGRLVLAGATLGTSFPFGLHRSQHVVGGRREIVVHPRIGHVSPSMLQAARGTGLDGPRSGRRRGQGEEWFGTRPARPGDRLRDIAWRISAHQDTLIAIERTRPQPPRMQVVLDLRLPTAELDEAAFDVARHLEEEAISCAASLLFAAHGSGDEVGLRVLGIEAAVHHPRRGSLHLDRMLSTLALLNLDGPREGQLHSGPVRSGEIVVQPDRVRPLAGLSDVLHVSARNWSSARDASRTESDVPHAVTTAVAVKACDR
jgi:uncharacterized protein (DUF58 family)